MLNVPPKRSKNSQQYLHTRSNGVANSDLTDTGGSVRHPAGNGNLVGIKATFGPISRLGVWASSWMTDQTGLLC